MVGGDRGGAEMTVLAGSPRPAAAAKPTRPEVAALLDSEEFLSATAQLASQSGRDVADVQAEAAVYVREMAASHVSPVVRAWHALSAWMVRGFQVVIDDDELAKLTGTGPRPRPDLLDLAPLLPGSVLLSATPCRRAASRRRSGWPAPTSISFRWAHWPDGTGSSRCDARRATCPHTGWHCARSSARWWPAAATWCGRSRAAGHAPANCGHRDTGCCGM